MWREAFGKGIQGQCQNQEEKPWLLTARERPDQLATLYKRALGARHVQGRLAFSNQYLLVLLKRRHTHYLDDVLKLLHSKEKILVWKTKREHIFNIQIRP